MVTTSNHMSNYLHTTSSLEARFKGDSDLCMWYVSPRVVRYRTGRINFCSVKCKFCGLSIVNPSASNLPGELRLHITEHQPTRYPPGDEVCPHTRESGHRGWEFSPRIGLSTSHSHSPSLQGSHGAGHRVPESDIAAANLLLSLYHKRGQEVAHKAKVGTRTRTRSPHDRCMHYSWVTSKIER